MKASGAYIWTDEAAREAKRDYCEAFWWVHHQNKPGMTMKELCKACGGHNFDYDMFFDMSYKRVYVTVQRLNNGTIRLLKEFEYLPEETYWVECNIEEFVDY